MKTILKLDGRLKSLREFTLEDAVREYEDGFCCICGNGRIEILTNDPEVM